MDPIIYKQIIKETFSSYQNSQLKFLKNEYQSLAISKALLVASIFNNNNEKNEETIGFLLNNVYSVKSLNENFTSLKITVLHVAVMANQLNVVKKLLALGVTADSVDCRNCLPLHHAAYNGNRAMVEVLLPHTKEQHLKNFRNGTYENILTFVRPKPLANDTTIPLLHKKKGVLQPLTQKEFYQKTDALFITAMLRSKSILMEDWKSPKQNFGLMENPTFIDIYQQGRKETLPPLRLKKILEGRNAGYGILTTTDLKKHRFVGDYLGEWQKPEEINAYTFCDVNPINYSNQSPRFNDGFPNLVQSSFANIDGLNEMQAFFTGEEIKAGTELLWNYGLHNVKFGPYLEIEPQKVRNFLKKNTFDELMKVVQRFETSVMNPTTMDFDLTFTISQLMYVVQTPSVFFHLMIDGTLTIAEAKKYYQFSLKYFKEGYEAQPILYNIVPFAEECLQIRDNLKQKYPEHATLYQQIFPNYLMNNGIVFTLKDVKTLNTALMPDLKANLFDEKTYLNFFNRFIAKKHIVNIL